ncbi:MAG: acyl-phosphate glycerol 3-phosphate acyltransferase [Terriglobia bacterium]|nr:MAG: acyl-phosphate glycerol 3-phosphate acyltransferase [Terriglobia bacterium]
MMPLVAVLIAYLLGAIPFGYLLVKWRTGSDVRSAGSGNIGATNVWRTSGKAIAVVTLLFDIAKGYLAVWIAERLTMGNPAGMGAAALAVMAGHAYPVFLRWRGGKAVASFIGAFLRLTPLPLLAVLLLFVAVVAWTRHISLGSIIAAGTFPLAVWLILQPPIIIVFIAILAGAFIVIRHSENIRRLHQGSEHVFEWGTRSH